MTASSLRWRGVVADLPAVTLDHLTATAALLTRVDRKYVVTPDAVMELLARHGDHLRALEIDGARVARYRSVYYDTPELASYLAAARRRPRRFKVRTREYVDSGTAAVEVKLRSPRGDTVKHREWLNAAQGRVSTDAAVITYASGFADVADHAARLRPALITTYTRTTLLGASGRITIDAAVAAEDARGESFAYGDALIVETKSARGVGELDRDLWAMGVRPVRLSKYATSLAALHPELPANRWHRTLIRHTPSRALAAAA